MYWRYEEDDDKAKFDCEADNDDPMSKKYGLQAQFITRIKFHWSDFQYYEVIV